MAAGGTVTQPAIQTAQTRPVVKLSGRGNYKNVLTIDGGGSRCMATVMLLRKMETTIKDQLLAKKTDLALDPPGALVDGMTVADFDIFLADYFDFMAGTSMGSVIAAYIALRGGESEKLLEDEDFLLGCQQFCRDKTYGVHTPTTKDERGPEGILWADYSEIIQAKDTGALKAKTATLERVFPKGSMRRLEVVFLHCLKKWYSAADTSGGGATTTQSLPLGDRIDNFLDFLFGDKNTDDVKQNLMITAFDTKTSEGLTFIIKPGDDSNTSSNVIVRREKVQEYDNDSVIGPHGDPHDDERYKAYAKVVTPLKLKDISRGSASYYPFVTIKNIEADVLLEEEDGSYKQESRETKRFELIDGSFVSNDPTLQALVAVPKISDTWKLQELTVLSIGSGLLTRSLHSQYAAKDFASIANKLGAYMSGQGQTYAYRVVLEVTSRYVPMLLKLYARQTPDFSTSRYARFQFGPEEENEFEAINDINGEHLTKIREIGENRAERAKDRIISFVESFVCVKP